MIDPIYIQAIIFAVLGGAVFAVALENLIPFFKFPKLDIRRTMIAMASTSILFWSTWLFPMGILLLLLGRPVWIVISLTVLFLAFVLSTLGTTILLGRARGAPADPQDLREKLKDDITK